MQRSLEILHKNGVAVYIAKLPYILTAKYLSNSTPDKYALYHSNL